MRHKRQEKINELKRLILEFGRGDVSEERACEFATNYYTHKRTFAEKIQDRFFNHMSLSQMANNVVIAERIRKENMQKA